MLATATDTTVMYSLMEPCFALTGPPDLQTILIDGIASRVVEAVKEQLAEQPPKVQPALLTVEEAGVYLARSTRAVEAMIHEGKLPVVRDGRTVRLARKDLDTWIENHTDQ